MCKRKYGWFAVAVMAFAVFFFASGDACSSSSHLCLRGLSGVNIITMATSTANTDDETAYYCRITETDGSMDVREMYGEDVSDLKKSQKDQYKAANKEWLELKKKWIKAVGRKPFPVAKPKPPKVRKLGKVPLTNKKRERAIKKHQSRLEVWNVCVVKDCEGNRSAKAIRRDKMHAQLQKLYKDYVELVIEWAEACKDDPDARDDKENVPKLPSISVFKGQLRSPKQAEELAKKLSEKLSKAAEEKDKPETKGEDKDKPEAKE